MDKISAKILLNGLAPEGFAGDAAIDLVTTDSREVRPGCIFVAFPGEKFDGHDFAAKALAEGAEYVVLNHPVEGVPAELYDNCIQHLPSPLMASGALVGGEIVAVEQEPYYVLSAGGDWIEDETHTTLLFTAVTETPTAEVMTTKVGDQEVRIGKTDYILKSEYMEFADGTIVDVQWEE